MKRFIVMLLVIAAVSFAIDVNFGTVTCDNIEVDSSFVFTGDTLGIASGIQFDDVIYFWDVDGDRVLQADSSGLVSVFGDLYVGEVVHAGGYNFATAAEVTGGADSIVIDFTTDIPALTAGLTVEFIAEAANTGACSLAVDGGAWKHIFEATDISALEVNDIRDTMYLMLKYDGTQWQQVSQSGN